MHRKIRSKLLSPALAGYEESMSPYSAAAGPGPDPGWLDAIIDPLETRTWFSMGIEAASQAPATREFNMGVLQT
jgi:acetyl-CoA carboxylase carboxyltransferase component